MASFKDYADAQITKALLVGNSGTGKTGATASLAAAGYNVRILDMDAGVEILNDLLKNPSSIYTKTKPGLWTQEQASTILDRVSYKTITEQLVSLNGRLVPKTAKAWLDALKLFDMWKTPTEDFGPISTWTANDVLVIDSLTFLCTAALNTVLALNGRMGQRPQQSDWGDAQGLVEGLLAMLYSDAIKCNVIINCHITYIGDESKPGSTQGYPAALGRALPPKIGRYFNTVLLARTVGAGATAKRVIQTNSTSMLELKTTAPLRVKPQYDLETGLAEYFKVVRENK